MTSARHGYVGGQWVAQPAYKVSFCQCKGSFCQCKQTYLVKDRNLPKTQTKTYTKKRRI